VRRAGEVRNATVTVILTAGDSELSPVGVSQPTARLVEKGTHGVDDSGRVRVGSGGGQRHGGGVTHRTARGGQAGAGRRAPSSSSVAAAQTTARSGHSPPQHPHREPPATTGGRTRILGDRASSKRVRRREAHKRVNAEGHLPAPGRRLHPDQHCDRVRSLVLQGQSVRHLQGWPRRLTWAVQQVPQPPSGCRTCFVASPATKCWNNPGKFPYTSGYRTDTHRGQITAVSSRTPVPVEEGRLPLPERDFGQGGVQGLTRRSPSRRS